MMRSDGQFTMLSRTLTEQKHRSHQGAAAGDDVTQGRLRIGVPVDESRRIVLAKGTIGVQSSGMIASQELLWCDLAIEDSVISVVSSIGIYFSLRPGEYGLEIAGDHNTFGAVSIGPRDDVATRLMTANERRLHLIDKQFDEGLTLDESSELERLQEEVSAIIDSQAPSRFDIIEELEAEIGQLD